MAYDLSGVNFLIVEDNAHMRNLVKTILHTLGVRNIREASDGADAFKELRSFPVDIILTDWAMSPIDGIEFTRLVRNGADSPNPYVPIIMLSAHTEMTRVAEARDAGVNEFLAKPISAKSLITRINAVIERPRPFVRSKNYFGPDRRRKDQPFNGPDRRKGSPAAVAGDDGAADKTAAEAE